VIEKGGIREPSWSVPGQIVATHHRCHWCNGMAKNLWALLMVLWWCSLWIQFTPAVGIDDTCYPILKWHKNWYPYNNIINTLKFVCVSVFVCVGAGVGLCVHGVQEVGID